MTLKELSEYPEQASEEDLKAFAECMKMMNELGKTISPIMNGVSAESGRSKEKIAYAYYVDTMLMAAILESFTLSTGEQEYKDINKFVFNYTDKAFMWDMPITTYFRCLARLRSMGLLELTKEDKYNPSFKITDEGILALQEQTYANLAQTALFNLKTQQLNDQTIELSKCSVRQNWMMLAVAVASAIAAFVSVFVALF